jgi:hypothetical protein
VEPDHALRGASPLIFFTCHDPSSWSGGLS